MAHLRAFIEACPAYGWSGGGQFSTRIKVLANGRERRNADWPQEQQRYTLPFVNVSAEKYVAVRQMFQVCRAKLHAFLYQDPNDFEADDELVAVAVPGQTVFKLTKTSVIDGVSYQREINALYRPGAGANAVATTPIMTVNGTPTAAFVADPDRGTVAFDSPMTGGEIVRWSGLFAVWVRFDQDWLPFSIDNRLNGDDYARNGQVELLELPPPEQEPES